MEVVHEQLEVCNTLRRAHQQIVPVTKLVGMAKLHHQQTALGRLVVGEVWPDDEVTAVQEYVCYDLKVVFLLSALKTPR